MYRVSSFLGWDSRVSRILANEKPLFRNSPSIAPCFKMAEKESESEGETIETGWSVSTSRVLIQFYSENPLLWDKNHKEYGKKNIITKTLKPLLAMRGKSRAANTEEAVKKRWHGLRSTTIYSKNFGVSSTASSMKIEWYAPITSLLWSHLRCH